MTYAISLLCLTFGLLGVTLQRLYSAVPSRELKRLAVSGDSNAQKMYRPVAFGMSLRLLLWIFTIGFLSVGLLVLARAAPAVVSAAAFVIVGALSLVILPSLALTNVTVRLAVWSAPSMTWLLQRMDGPLKSIGKILNRFRAQESHSRLYEKSDVHELLERQKTQTDNRISEDELARAQQALKFSDELAADIAVPTKKFRAIEAHESLGPVLLDELHASKQTSFVVFDGTFDNIVGTLTLADALKAKQGGQVSGAMRPSITYVHESFTLPEVLAALTTTGQHLAVVVNAFAEVVGIITLEQLVYELACDLPDQTLAYDDRQSVAASRQTFEKPNEPKDENAEADDSDEASEAEAFESGPDIALEPVEANDDFEIVEESPDNVQTTAAVENPND